MREARAQQEELEAEERPDNAIPQVIQHLPCAAFGSPLETMPSALLPSCQNDSLVSSQADSGGMPFLDLHSAADGCMQNTRVCS